MIVHSTQQVAQTIKILLTRNRMKLVPFALKNGVTPAQIYNVLNGRDYISASWALKFNAAVGVSIFYCLTGTLPVIDPEHRYDTLLNATREYKQAVDSEDRIRDELEAVSGEIDDNDKLKLASALKNARLNRIKLGVKLESVLADESIVDDYETEDEKSSGSIETKDSQIEYKERTKLHEAIISVIRSAGHPLSYSEIAHAVNERHLYSRRDGEPVPTSQVSARVKNYPQLFNEIKNDVVTKIDLK